jgi:hypothetical protein
MTKYFAVFFLLCVLFQNTFAQKTDLKGIYTDITTAINSALLTRKGSLEIRGSMFYDRVQTTYKGGPNFVDEEIQLKPALYYMIFDHIGLGGMFSYTKNSSQVDGDSDKAVVAQTAIGPSLKKYFCKDKWRPFASAGYLVHVGDNWEGGEFDLGLGMMYHLQSTTAMSLEINYGFIRPSEKTIENRSRILIGIGISSFIL